MGLIKVKIELPEEVIAQAHIPRDQLDRECQKMVAMELYRKGYLTIGKACEIGKMSQWEFFDLNKETQALIHYDEEDLKADRKLAKEIFK